MPPASQPVEVALCPCGSGWWRLVPFDLSEQGGGTGVGAVAIDGNGMVIAMSGMYQCIECESLAVLPQMDRPTLKVV